MNHHPYFDLLLHDDAELGTILGSAIRSRETIHEWPLSCVQRVRTTSDREIIYKSQCQPSVEPEVYASAHSDLLPAAQTLYRSDDHSCMVIEVVHGRRVNEAGLSEDAVVALGRNVIDRIQGMASPRPHLVDVSTPEKWENLVFETVRDIRTLVGQGTFIKVSQSQIAQVERCATESKVRDAIRRRPGYLHSDLTVDNLFVRPDGPCVIDWQHPKLGPIDVDLAILLESVGIDPYQYVDPAVIVVMHVFRIHWFVACARTWFPPSAATYDTSVASLIDQIRPTGIDR